MPVRFRLGAPFARPAKEIVAIANNLSITLLRIIPNRNQSNSNTTQLSLAVTDLRVDMIQGQAALRQDISEVRIELRSEIERQTFWLMTAHYGALLALLGFLGKHFIESYFK